MRKLFVCSLFACLGFLLGGQAAWAAEAETPKGREAVAGENRPKWLGETQSPLAQTDPELEAIKDRLIYGEIVANKTLDDKTASLIILASLAAGQNWEALGSQIDAALRVGATALEVRETFYQCAPYIGFPRVEKAIMHANIIFRRTGATLPLENQATVDENTRLPDGLQTQKDIFGAETIESMQEKAPADQKNLLVDYLSGYCFGDFYTRQTLDLKMRELIVFSAIVSLGGCDPQAQAHAAANITVGNTKQNLVDALAIMLPYIGFPRTLNGLNAVNAGVSEN